jgi:hypothetical protein
MKKEKIKGTNLTTFSGGYATTKALASLKNSSKN